MKALILAAGFGVRLREIIHGRPKHLAPINGQPFLRYLVRLLKVRGIKEIVIAVGYLANYIIDEFTRDNEGLTIKFSEDQRPLGTAGSIKKAAEYLKDDFIIVNGDTYLDIDYFKLMADHQRSKSLLTIVGTTKHKDKGGIILAKNKTVTDFIVDSHTSTPVNSYRNAGVYAASPRLFSFIPSFTKISLEKDIIPLLLSQHQPISLFPVNQTFIDIGSPESFMEAANKLT